MKVIFSKNILLFCIAFHQNLFSLKLSAFSANMESGALNFKRKIPLFTSVSLNLCPLIWKIPTIFLKWGWNQGNYPKFQELTNNIANRKISDGQKLSVNTLVVWHCTVSPNREELCTKTIRPLCFQGRLAPVENKFGYIWLTCPKLGLACPKKVQIQIQFLKRSVIGCNSVFQITIN